MLLRNSISNTKKFFQKTLDNVKSFISKGSTYQRLPKTPPFHPFSCGRDTNDQMDGDAGYNNNNNELDHFYNEFTHQWDNSRKSKVKNKVQKLKSSVVRGTSTKKSQQFFSLDHSSQKENCNSYAAITEDSRKTPDIIDGDFNQENYAANGKILKNKRLNIMSPSMNMKFSDLCSKSVRERRLSFVAEKLKELEVMDKGNVDQKRDVEEFLRYYSRLTCPAYLDIVEKFLKEMCTEFFGPHQASPKVSFSKPVWKAVKV